MLLIALWFQTKCEACPFDFQQTVQGILLRVSARNCKHIAQKIINYRPNSCYGLEIQRVLLNIWEGFVFRVRLNLARLGQNGYGSHLYLILPRGCEVDCEGLGEETQWRRQLMGTQREREFSEISDESLLEHRLR